MNNLYCIVGTGRSGSSLLAAIIAMSGGNFGLDTQVEWDHIKGSMEHPLCHICYKHLSRISKLKDSILPQKVFGISFLESKFKDNLRKFKTVKYAKSSTLVWLVPYFTQVGIHPKVIVSYRSFEDFALSRHAKFGWDYKKLADTYTNVYMTAWLQLHIYGGIIVDFSDVCNPQKNEWKDSVSKFTGLKTIDLIKSRDLIIKQVTPKPKILPQHLYSTIYHIERLFEQNKNQIIAGKLNQSLPSDTPTPNG